MAQGFIIRAVATGDRAAWTAMWTQYLAFYQTELPAEVFAATWARLLDEREPIWGALALENDVPVGLTHFIYHRSAWMLGDACYLQDLFVAPQGRGRGYGRALIEHVSADAARNGVPRIYWLTHETNATAMQLYDSVAARSGFVQYRKSTVSEATP
jgi:GNAT superfamily N-acetyltransferase